MVNFLENLKVQDSFEFEKFKIYPILCQKNTVLNYVSLKEAIKNDYITLTEVDSVGSISDIIIENNSGNKVLIWDGEMLIGSKQDRVFNSSILIQENSKVILPVSCIEQGRWSHRIDKFLLSENSVPIQLRNLKSKSVHETLSNSGSFLGNQSKIWYYIEYLSDSLQIKSKTLALNEIMAKKVNDNKEKLEEIKAIENQCGVIISLNNNIIGMEYISNSEVFKDLYSRILGSYFFMINFSEQVTKTRIGHPCNVEEFFWDIKDIMVEKYKSVGLGNDYRFLRNDVIGSAIVYKKSIVNFSISYNC